MATGYQSGADILANIINNIANTLITNYSSWSDGDTTWTTIDTSGDNARRCLVYDYGGSGQQYITLEVIGDNKLVARTFHDSSYHYTYVKGLRIRICDTWDSVNHTLGSGYYSTLIPFAYNGSESSSSADLSILNLTYYLWIDLSGFVIMAKPEPQTDSYQQSFILSVEKIGTKEYTDGSPDFTIFNTCNIYPVLYYHDGDNYDPPTYVKHRALLRFNKYQWPNVGYTNQTSSTPITSSPENNGISFPMKARKSTGNSKVYYIKPIFHNTSGSTDPIAQLELFVPWDESLGLAEGDVIQLDGSTTKYLCLALDSPDSTNRLNYAIKYEA